MTVGQLKDEYRDVFGESSRSNHKQFLFRRIAWRMQANAYGGLPERARRRALEAVHAAVYDAASGKVKIELVARQGGNMKQGDTE